MSRIVVDPDVMCGEPRIEGRRVGVRQVVEMVERGAMHPGVVADDLELDALDVYRALVYYHEHPEEMATVRERREEREAAARSGAITGPADLDVRGDAEPHPDA